MSEKMAKKIRRAYKKKVEELANIKVESFISNEQERFRKEMGTLKGSYKLIRKLLYLSLALCIVLIVVIAVIAIIVLYSMF